MKVNFMAFDGVILKLFPLKNFLASLLNTYIMFWYSMEIDKMFLNLVILLIKKFGNFTHFIFDFENFLHRHFFHDSKYDICNF